MNSNSFCFSSDTSLPGDSYFHFIIFQCYFDNKHLNKAIIETKLILKPQKTTAMYRAHFGLTRELARIEKFKILPKTHPNKCSEWAVMCWTGALSRCHCCCWNLGITDRKQHPFHILPHPEDLEKSPRFLRSHSSLWVHMYFHCKTWTSLGKRDIGWKEEWAVPGHTALRFGWMVIFPELSQSE